MTRLTGRQAFILEHIVIFIQEKGYSPSIRDLQRSTGINTQQGIAAHLEALDRKGYIERGNSTARTIRVIKNPSGERVRLAFIPLEQAS